MTWLLPVPVILPLLAAGLSLVLGRFRRAQLVVTVLALATSLGAAIAMAFEADTAPMVLDVGSWAAPVGVSLVADRLTLMMLIVSLVVTVGVLVYSSSQSVSRDESSSPMPVYYPSYLVLSAGVSDAFLAGDLFNLYIGFEILLAASFVLITLGGTRSRVRSGTVYVVVSLFSSAVFLLGLAFTYAAVGTVNMAQLAVRLSELAEPTRLMLQATFLVAFGIKAAIFPLSAWLPDSYPTAPAPVTAVFAGLLTKVGVYAIIRTQFLLFPGGGWDTVLAVLGIFTMIVGILGAIAQDDIKRMVSFTLVSHIGFMVWGISISSKEGLGAAIVYAAHHILVQTTLFLIVGLMQYLGGTTSLAKLGGLAGKSPLLSGMFLIVAFNLVGIPPLTGFLGKVGLARASVLDGTGRGWALLAAGLIASLLTLYVVVKAWSMAFWQPAEGEASTSAEAPVIPKLPRAMVAATAGLLLVQVGMAGGMNVIYGYALRAASDLVDRTPYISAVLGHDGRGSGASSKVVRRSDFSVVPPLNEQPSKAPELWRLNEPQDGERVRVGEAE